MHIIRRDVLELFINQVRRLADLVELRVALVLRNLFVFEMLVEILVSGIKLLVLLVLLDVFLVLFLEILFYLVQVVEHEVFFEQVELLVVGRAILL